MKNFKKNNNKTFKRKNLSPAKKFKLRLRRAKMQQRMQQSKDDYFEHDTRSNVEQRAKPVKEKINKKGRRAQMYIDAYLKSQREMCGNGSGGVDCDNLLPEEIYLGGDGNLLKSTIHKTDNNNSRFREIKEQEQSQYQKAEKDHPLYERQDRKCCCHCACMGAKRAYDEYPVNYMSGGNIKPADFPSTSTSSTVPSTAASAKITTKFLNKTTTTTLETAGAALLKATPPNDLVNLNMCIDSNLHPNHLHGHHPQFLPFYNTNNNSFDFVRTRGSGGVREMRSVIRYFSAFLSFSLLLKINFFIEIQLYFNLLFWGRNGNKFIWQH